MVMVMGVVGAMAGLLVGLLTDRARVRWCPTCGATLTCPDPTYHVGGQPPQPNEVYPLSEKSEVRDE
jgi:hypothetical protein